MSDLDDVSIRRDDEASAYLLEHLASADGDESSVVAPDDQRACIEG